MLKTELIVRLRDGEMFDDGALTDIIVAAAQELAERRVRGRVYEGLPKKSKEGVRGS